MIPASPNPDRGRPAYAVCRCGNWETDHDATGRCALIPNPDHRYAFYEFLYDLRDRRLLEEQAHQLQELEDLRARVGPTAFAPTDRLTAEPSPGAVTAAERTERT